MSGMESIEWVFTVPVALILWGVVYLQSRVQKRGK